VFVLTTDQKGNVAEQAVVLAATKLELSVLRPVGEGCRYDLVLDLGSRLLRVQCKWARRHEGVVVVRCQSNRRGPNGLEWRSYTSEQVDAIAAYCPDVDSCYLLPIERVEGCRQVHLRLVPAKNAQRGGIVWAHDFEFSAIDWAALGAVAQLEERRRGTPKAGGSSPPSSTLNQAGVVNLGAHEFRNHFGYYLERAAAGDEVRVTRHGKPFARLLPAAA
jgi:prevent-host-death family protein